MSILHCNNCDRSWDIDFDGDELLLGDSYCTSCVVDESVEALERLASKIVDLNDFEFIQDVLADKKAEEVTK